MDYLVVGIGNREGGDDAIGPYVCERLLSYELMDIDVLDVGIAPENFTDVIKKKKPNTLIIVDAVEMNLTPGEIRRIPRDRIGVMHMSTHGIPLSVLMKYIEQYIASVILIGIQPKKMNGPMSDMVKAVGDQLVSLILSKKVEHILKLS